MIKPYLDILCTLTDLVQKKVAYYWAAEEYPSSDISLRNISRNSIILKLISENKPIVIGEVDFQSAFRIIHPGAVYLHDGNSYLVKNLNLEDSAAELIPLNDNYITEPRVNSSIKVDSVIQSNQNNNFNSFFGELRVIEKVTGYKRIDWKTQQLLGIEDLDLPEQELLTKGVWLCLSSTLVNGLRENNLWQSDPNQYGKQWLKVKVFNNCKR